MEQLVYFPPVESQTSAFATICGLRLNTAEAVVSVFDSFRIFIAGAIEQKTYGKLAEPHVASDLFAVDFNESLCACVSVLISCRNPRIYLVRS